MAYKKEIVDRMRREIGSDFSFEDLVFESEKMKEVINQAKNLAARDKAILLAGEDGVGKKVISKCIHQQSSRKKEIFLQVDCKAIEDDFLKAELFGVEKDEVQGFPGTYSGKIFQVQHGTLFLDEVAACPLLIQAELLGFLETKKVYRAKDPQKKTLDIRLIVSTAKKLSDEVNLKKFRSDLYYRLMECFLVIPPLRDRREDIIPLFLHYMEMYNLVFKKSVTKIDYIAEDYLRKYDWWGNVEELKQEVKRIIQIKKNGTIGPGDLSFPIIAGLKPGEKRQCTLEENEKKYVIEVLKTTGFELNQAAARMAIEPQVLLRKIKNYDLEDTLREIS